MIQAPIHELLPDIPDKSFNWVKWYADADIAINLVRNHAGVLQAEVNVMDPPFNATGDLSADDTAAFRLAAAHFKSLIRLQTQLGTYALPAVFKLPSGHGFKLTGSLNFQSIRANGWAIEMTGAEIFASMASRPIFDCLGSAFGTFNGGILYGDTGSPPAYWASVGRITQDANPGGGHSFNNIQVYGSFSVASMLNSASEGNSYKDCIWHNSIAHPSLIIDGYHHVVPLTDFTPSAWPQDTADSCIQHEILNCDFETNSGPVIHMIECGQVRAFGYLRTPDAAGILFQSRPGQIFSDFDLNLHLEPNTSTANFRAENFSAGNSDFYGFNLRDIGSQASVAVIQAGTNVTALTIHSGDLFNGPGTVTPAWTNGPVTFGTGIRLNGEYRRFAPGTPAGAAQTGVLSCVTGVPSNGDGANGDLCWRTDGGAGTTIYQRRAGAWVGIV